MKKSLFALFTVMAMITSFCLGAMAINAVELVTETTVTPIAYAISPAITLASVFVSSPMRGALFCIPTQGIVHNPCQENAPGVELYGYFFMHDDVLTWATKPTTLTNPGDSKVLVGNHIFKTGKQMYPLYITPDTGEVKGSLQGERDCRSWKNIIEAFTPGMNNTQKEFADFLKNANVVILQRDKSNVMHQIGGEGTPAYCESADIYTGKDATGKRGIDLVLSANQSLTPMTYNGTLQLTPAV